MSNEHEHKFNIPVEWKYRNEYPGNGDPFARVAKRVTKLKCTGCSEEIER